MGGGLRGAESTGRAPGLRSLPLRRPRGLEAPWRLARDERGEDQEDEARDAEREIDLRPGGGNVGTQRAVIDYGTSIGVGHLEARSLPQRAVGGEFFSSTAHWLSMFG